MSASGDLPSNVHCASHPLVVHKITRLRNRETKPAEFRQLLKEISFYLGYEVRYLGQFVFGTVPIFQFLQ